MQKFRVKWKGYMVEAYRWFESMGETEGVAKSDNNYWCETELGSFPITDGNWIIKDDEGVYHVCAPDAFQKLYEKAE